MATDTVITLDMENIPFCMFIVRGGIVRSVNNASILFFAKDITGQKIGDIFKQSHAKSDAFYDTPHSILSAMATVEKYHRGVTLRHMDLHIAGQGIQTLDIDMYLQQNHNNNCDNGNTGDNSDVMASLVFCLRNVYTGDGGINPHVSGIVSMLAHEIKNPLSSIRGGAELVATPENKGLTDLIQQETDRITNLVESLETLAEDENISCEKVNIHKVLNKAVALAQLGFGKNVRYVLEYDPSIPDVWGNYDKLLQVYINILKNAVCAMEKRCDGIDNTAGHNGMGYSVGGQGKAELGTTELGTTELGKAEQESILEQYGLEPKAGYENICTIKTYYMAGVSIPFDNKTHRAVAIDITDTGGGIDMAHMNDIFTPYVSHTNAGKGLGLAIVSRIIKNHNGRIRLENVPDGVQVRTILPLAIT